MTMITVDKYPEVHFDLECQLFLFPQLLPDQLSFSCIYCVISDFQQLQCYVFEDFAGTCLTGSYVPLVLAAGILIWRCCVRTGGALCRSVGRAI